MNPFKPPANRQDRQQRKRRKPRAEKDGTWMLGVMFVALGVLAVVSALEILRT